MAAHNQISLSGQSSTICSNSRDNSIVTALACDCTSVGNQLSSQCFKTSDTIPVAIGKACPGLTT